MISFGNVILNNGLFLAPMAGFSDHAMRVLCHEMGAEYSVTEMVSAKAVTYGDKKTFALAKIQENEGRVAVQIFGSEPDVMAKAAQRLSHGEEGGIPPCAIDINMGCPVHKVFSNGEGSALMRKPELIRQIVKSVSGSIDIPCTVKIRLGVDSEHENAVECALAAQEGGAQLLTVHGRTRVQMYSGSVNQEVIAKVKQNLHIPVIANGDIRSAEDAVSVLRNTGADGIMIGRGAIGNPFIFREIRAELLAEDYTPPSLEERIETALSQLSMAISEKGEAVAVRESRKQTALYLRSFRGAAQIRADINKAETYEDVKRALLSALNNGGE